MKRFNKHFMPLQFKLLCYFLLFGLIILIVLWVFQTFFLESFYTMTKSSQVEKNASIISDSIKKNEDVHNTIENVASYNSLSVYVYDSSENIFNLMYSCEYDNPATALAVRYHEVYSFYKNAFDNGGQYLHITNNRYQDIARIKFEQIFKHSATDDMPDSEIKFYQHGEKNIKNMVYADIIELSDGSECFLMVTSSITPLSNTVEIIKHQLIIVSMVFILLAIFFSLYASNRIAKPISKTNTVAKQLAKKNYEVEFDATGYLEVEELNETLNYAKTELTGTQECGRVRSGKDIIEETVGLFLSMAEPDGAEMTEKHHAVQVMFCCVIAQALLIRIYLMHCSRLGASGYP